jgi:hypothetical protein
MIFIFNLIHRQSPFWNFLAITKQLLLLLISRKKIKNLFSFLFRRLYQIANKTTLFFHWSRLNWSHWIMGISVIGFGVGIWEGKRFERVTLVFRVFGEFWSQLRIEERVGQRVYCYLVFRSLCLLRDFEKVLNIEGHRFIN